MIESIVTFVVVGSFVMTFLSTAFLVYFILLLSAEKQVTLLTSLPSIYLAPNQLT